jgi:hypothetical protein
MKYFFSLLAAVFLCFISFFSSYAGVSAEDQEVISLQEFFNELSIDAKDINYIHENYEIDISPLNIQLWELYPEEDFSYSWDIFGSTPQEGTLLWVTFETPGKKQISLNIYSEADERNLIYTTSFFPLIYESVIPLVVDPNIDETKISAYQKNAEDLGIFLWILSQDQASWLSKQHEMLLENFQNVGDYITLWWGKEFLFESLSNFENDSSRKSSQMHNFVLLSSYNTALLRKYIENSSAGKTVIESGFVIDDISRIQLLKNPLSYSQLSEALRAASYTIHPLSDDILFSPIFFLSHFVNQLAREGIPNTQIYIILLIPFFFTLVSIAKHIVGIGVLGNLIPIFLAILCMQLNPLFLIFLFLFLIGFNIVLGKFLGKYTLLYTPKVALMTILNILVFILSLHILSYSQILTLELNNIIYAVIFFIISEKLITIITSKEFREYKKSITGTLFVSLSLYGLSLFDTFTVFLFSYPEIILLLVPLNFYIGRFTGLRMSEFFRFRDILKTEAEE